MLKNTLITVLIVALLLPAVSLGETVITDNAFIPGSRAVGQADSYWETPMDITQTERIWAMLTAPITVLDGHQKNQTVLRKEPRADAEAVADVTFDSQGVHVLETLDNGWSLVEVYSSSFHDSKVKAWNQLVQGYIKTSLLKEKKVNQKYGLVVDKLDQRLYIFVEGALYDVLSVSTGLANERQPYNETRSGEFLIVSPVGDFVSDNVVGEYALRFNDGDFLHQVPYIARGDSKVYEPLEKVLGQRASHGCIRVQRKRTPKGTSMRWIWDVMRRNMGTRIIIWEDLQGRSLGIPDARTPLYYNPQGGKDYHVADKCYGVRDKYLPLTAFTYGELENPPYSVLNACQYCVPPRRLAEIEAINQAHRASGL